MLAEMAELRAQVQTVILLVQQLLMARANPMEENLDLDGLDLPLTNVQQLERLDAQDRDIKGKLVLHSPMFLLLLTCVSRS